MLSPVRGGAGKRRQVTLSARQCESPLSLFNAAGPDLVVTTHQVAQVVEPGETVVELVDLQTFKRVQCGGPTKRTGIR